MNRRTSSAGGVGILGMVCAAAVLTTASHEAGATSSIYNAWRTKYPTSTLPTRIAAANGSACYICHHPTSTSNTGNCYRSDLTTRIAGGMTATQAINAIDGVDSDGDGVPNGVEITMARTDIPGQVGYSPGLRGATGTDPCWSNPNTPVTNQLETPPPPACHGTCVADFDDGSGLGHPDGGVTIDDLLYYLGIFDAGAICADVDDGSGSGTGDGGVTIDDLLYYLLRFDAGC